MALIAVNQLAGSRPLPPWSSQIALAAEIAHTAHAAPRASRLSAMKTAGIVCGAAS